MNTVRNTSGGEAHLRAHSPRPAAFSALRVTVCGGLLAIGLTAGTAANAARSPVNSRGSDPVSIMGQGSFVLPPLAAVKFCMTYPGECKTGQAVRLHHDGELSGLIERVNRSVNAKIRPQPEAAGEDEWLLNVSAGDCDDYAVQKRHDLIKAGIPASALLLAAAVTGYGENHLVLIVTTDKGDFVLDNLRSDIRLWSRTGYRWISRQSHSNPQFWAAINRASPVDLPVVAMNGDPITQEPQATVQVADASDAVPKVAQSAPIKAAAPVKAKVAPLPAIRVATLDMPRLKPAPLPMKRAPEPKVAPALEPLLTSDRPLIVEGPSIMADLLIADQSPLPATGFMPVSEPVKVAVLIEANPYLVLAN